MSNLDHKKYLVGYYRLSVEDNDTDVESNSIVNQRLLIRDFIAQDLELSEMPFKEYLDDGYSGASMERPGMQKLLDLVRKEQVACIVVKDFSRFSRDYIELGTYLEHIFPFIEVRFIAITDHYDSIECKAKTLDTDAQFKSLLNDFYVKDQSVKVKAAKKVRRENGEYCCGLAPFGYEVDASEKRNLIIVESEAEIIRRIFDMTLKRFSKIEICKLFNQEEVLTPAEMIALRVPKKSSKASENKPTEKKKWTVDMISHIVNNKTNYGCMVYGKTKIFDPGTGKEILVPREDWQVMENHHAPIVSKEMFEEAQRLQQRHVAVRKGRGTKHYLTSYIKCGACGHNMSASQPIKGHYYYSCPYAGADAHTKCFKGKIDNKILEQMILSELKRQIQSQVDRVEMDKQMRAQHNELLTGYEKEAQANEQEILILKEMHKKNYELYQQGKMEREALLAEKEKLAQKRVRCEARIQELQPLIEQERALLSKQIMPKEELLDYLGFEKLSQEIVEKYLSAVRIYDDGRLDIAWKK